MAFLKKWKTKWALKSLTFDQLFGIVAETITKQLDDFDKKDISLEGNLVIDYEADSVDVVAILLHLEDIFKNASKTTRIAVPTDKLGQIVLVEDILDIMYEVLLDVENKMDVFAEIKPDYAALNKAKING
jgi:acyl carrier protein